MQWNAKRTYISLRLALILAFFSSFVVYSLSSSELGEGIKAHVSHKFLFFARTYFGLDPKLDPRIKIFVYDDPTISHFKTGNLTMDQWADVIRALARRQPRAIIFDKLFDLPEQGADLAGFVEKIGKNVPLYAGSFVSSNEIPGRDQMPSSLPGHDLKKLSGHANWEGDFSWLEYGSGFLYGPHLQLLPGFRSVGHIMYIGNGWIYPMLRYHERFAVPHLGFFASNLELREGQPWISERPIPLNRKGRILVNLADPGSYLAKTYSMKALIVRALRQGDIPVVDKGDVVLILPAMYTGHTDWIDSPHGMIPGGYLLLSVMHSAVAGEWLRYIEWDFLWIVIFTAIGSLVGIGLWGTTFQIAIVVGLLGGGAIGVAMFSLLATVVPWLFPTAAFLLTSTSLYAVRLNKAKKEQFRLEAEMRIATSVQETFFPQRPIRTPGADVCGKYYPASECSGDWWGFHSLDANRDVLIIGDALGHGLPAAFITATAFASCRTVLETMRDLPWEQAQPSYILNQFNRVLFSATGGDIFMTLCVAIFDHARKNIHFANAGHHLPMIIGRNGQDKAKGLIHMRSGNPLGIIENELYHDHIFSLMGEERIVFFTDGIVECRNAQGKMYGKRRLRNCIEASASLSPKEAVEILWQDALAFSARGERNDDVTLVVVDLLAHSCEQVSA